MYATDLPTGATLHGYEPFVVQELLIHNENTRYLRVRYALPGGGALLTPFPPSVLPVAGGHFGANLVAHIVAQYHHAQVTEPLLLEQLLGGLVARGVSPELVVLSDGAPQFVVFVHASCWVHAERPLAKRVQHNEEHRTAIEKVRGEIWDLYQDLKHYREEPDAARRPVLEASFDALVGQRSGYPSIDGVLKEMREHRADLLRVLERPEVPCTTMGWSRTSGSS